MVKAEQKLPAKAPAGAVTPFQEVRAPKLIERMAARFGVDQDKMLETLKQTAFRQRPAKEGKQPVIVTNEHLMMLLLLAERYSLDPFAKMLYAFPQDGGITPVVGYDGWLNIMNGHPMHDYCEDHYAPIDTPQEGWYHEVEIKRKDRSRPTITRKYLKEYYRDTNPWNDMPKHMIEIKTTIQCIRKAYGIAGIYDPDEAERIFANAIDVTPRGPAGKPRTETPKALNRNAAPPAADEVTRITLDQATSIADKLKEEGVSLERFLAHVGLASIEDIDARGYVSALEAIDELVKP